MSEREIVDVSELPNVPPDATAALWWGMVVLIAVLATVLAAIVSSFLYFAAALPSWPPAGVRPPSATLGVLGVALAFAAVVPLRRATRIMAERDGHAARLVLWSAALLAGAALALRALSLAGFASRWDDDVYGSIVWALFGFHAGLAGVLFTIVVTLAILARNADGEGEERATVRAAGLYAAFVAVAAAIVETVVLGGSRLL